MRKTNGIQAIFGAKVENESIFSKIIQYDTRSFLTYIFLHGNTWMTTLSFLPESVTHSINTLF